MRASHALFPRILLLRTPTRTLPALKSCACFWELFFELPHVLRLIKKVQHQLCGNLDQLHLFLSKPNTNSVVVRQFRSLFKVVLYVMDVV